MEQPRKPRGRLNASQMDSIRRGQSARSDAGARAQEGKTRPAPKRPVGAKAAAGSRAAGSRTKAGGRQGSGAGFAFGAKRAPGKDAKTAKPKNTNLRTALMLLFFPVGIPMMWRRSCTWPRGVKIGISAVIAAALLAVVLYPQPDARVAGGIQMVSNKPEVEVYGPAIPATTMPAYTNSPGDSIIVDATENEVHYVYAADGAECYHEYECKFAYASSHRLTVYEAYFLGYKPCGRCNPPVYEGQK